MRIGIGYDIHRVRSGLPLILGGIEISSSFGLEGHSDADVLVHAVMDALLGAAALGDIGFHFPPDDERYANISSMELLHAVVTLLQSAGYEVVNVDSVLIAEAPKIGPYRKQMQDTMASVLGIRAADIGIKATTNEGVGPEGRLEAISAHAIALVRSST